VSFHELYATQTLGFPILGVLLVLPLLLTAVLRLLNNETVIYRISLLGAGLELLLSLLVLSRFRTGTADLQFVERWSPFGNAGPSLHLGVDGISVLFLPLTALLTLLVILYAEEVEKINARGYLMAVFGLQAITVGIFSSLSLLQFVLFSAAELYPAFLLIDRWGTGSARRAAAWRYTAVMGASSVLLLVALGVLYYQQAQSLPGLGLSADLLMMLETPVPTPTQDRLFLLLFLAVALRAPLFPFHTWLPSVMEEGPVVGMSVFVVGLKVGCYTLLRFVFPLCPESARHWFWLMAISGGITMIYAALVALVQTQLRRMMAFACISHVGLVVIGLCSLNLAALEGGVLQMLNLGIVAAGLFFAAGFLHVRLASIELDAVSGLAHQAPGLTVSLLLLILASIGMPGTAGFRGEHLALEGTLDASHWLMTLSLVGGTFLTAAYSLRYYQSAFLTKASDQHATRIADLRLREYVIVASLGLLVMGLGLNGGPALRVMETSLRALAERVEQKHGGLESRRDIRPLDETDAETSHAQEFSR
jgi:NADH-quinone oxidoreductase subunit M